MSRLALEGLSLAVGERVLARGVDCLVDAGQRVAVRGPSGVGKTTLLRAVAGLDDPAAGRVTLDGQPPEALGWPQFRRQVVYVSQVPALLAATVEANLRRPFSFASAGAGSFSRARCLDYLQALGLGEGHLRQEVRTLSVGEQQRVCLVRALLVAPRFVLLDEPTSALDDAATGALEDLIRAEGEARGLGALVVTHDAIQAGRWCERTLELRAVGPDG